MRKYLFILFLFAGTLLFAQEKEKEQDLHWPREIQSGEYTITLYQAQMEKLEKNILTGRMALSLKNKKDDIIFGALWFEAQIFTDLDKRTVTLDKINITKIKFPDVKDESKVEKLKSIIKTDLESIDLVMSLDRILASIESVNNESKLSSKLDNDPPKIYYRTKPTVLIVIDGDPIYKEIEGSKLETVINTPFLIIKDKKNFYIHGGEYWYKSDKIITEKWSVTKSVPKDVEKVAKKLLDSKEAPPEEEDSETSKEIPDLIVTSKPSELIVSNGEPEYEPINETSLLYVKNSENDILLHIKSQKHYVLINGRWYQSKSMKDGEWVFVEPKSLPEDFAAIPDEASISSVKVSVPGTPEAKEALYEQQIPQTAVVDRKTATTKVEYDGKPKFEKIDGTEVQYAVNTASSVILVNKTYYCVDDGIWFESSKPDGPWKVSDSRPEEVEKIPPSAPVYNIKYVYVYDSTPEVVYVGYTPGYCNSYVYGGVVVYGTGYYYRPWYGAHYYPRPITYGFGVHYNPYTGWGFSFGISYGWFSVSMHSYGRGYWGPAGYRHGYRHGYHHGYHHGYNSGFRAGYRYGNRQPRNIYNRRPTGVRQPRNSRDRVSTMPANKKTDRMARPSNKPNNVYTDKKGNIYSRDKNGNWTQKNKRPATTRPSTRPSTGTGTRPSTRPATKPSTRPSTRPTQPAQRPSTRPAPSTRPSTRPATRPSNQLQRDYQNRNRGTRNYNNYRNSRPASRPVSRPAPRPSRPSPARRRR
jgi:hypothetical protein